MAYRTSGRKTGVHVVRAPAPPRFVYVLSLVATLGCALALGLSHGTTIACSRTANTCVVRGVVGPGAPLSSTTLALSTIGKAETRYRPDSGAREVVIVHDGRVDAFRTEGLNAGGLDVGRELNDYLATPSRDELRLDTSSSAPFWLWLGTTLVLVGVVLVARTTIVIDHGAGVLRMRTTVRGRDLEMPFADIERVALHSKTDDDSATVTAPALVRRDGSLVYLRPHSRDEPELKRKLLAEVAAALDLPS